MVVEGGGGVDRLSLVAPLSAYAKNSGRLSRAPLMRRWPYHVHVTTSAKGKRDRADGCHHCEKRVWRGWSRFLLLLPLASR